MHFFVFCAVKNGLAAFYTQRVFAFQGGGMTAIALHLLGLKTHGISPFASNLQSILMI